MTSFDLTVQRRFAYAGKQQSYLLARCADKRFFAHATAAFRDGTRISGTVVRGCKQR
ncbi:hypothetical protein D3C83_205340 [compost metagenome]